MWACRSELAPTRASRLDDSVDSVSGMLPEWASLSLRETLLYRVLVVTE